MKDGIKSTVPAVAAAVALLFFLSLSIAQNLGLPVSVYPNETQASQTHYNQNVPFNVTLYVNATNNLSSCNASITLNGAGINFTSLPGTANTTYIGNITNQSTMNTSWELVVPGRGAKYVNFSLSCNGSAQPANTTIYIDLLNITLVNVTTPYSTRWNDSYIEVYRNSTYNVSVTVVNIVPAQTLENVTVYLNDANSSAFSLNSSSQTSRFNVSAANAPVGTTFQYNITSNDSQRDRLAQTLVIRVISPLNVSLTFNDSGILANQSFTATATASNYGPLNLTSINLTLVQYDNAFLTATNSSCAIFSLTPANTSNNCVWTFNSTGPNANANLTVTATSAEGDNNTYASSTRVYGWGNFTTNASIFFGTYNHTAGSVAKPITLNAAPAEDLINFNCTSTGELNSAISCQSLANLSKSGTTAMNISLAIPQYTAKGMHYGNVSVYAENANPQNVSYSINITGINNCSGQASASLGTRPGGSSTPIVSINITNTGNSLLNATCASGCNTFTGPSISPGGSASYNISVSMVGSTSTSVRIDCANGDPDLISGTTNFTFTIYYPAADTGGTTQNTNTNNNNYQAPQTPSNQTTYTYTVGLLPAAATIKKGESADFTIEVKNTGTGALSNITISGDSTLQFSVTPTKITSIPKGQSGYSKITATTADSTAAGNYKVSAKACRTPTSCVTSVESTLTIEEDEPVPTAQNETNQTSDAAEAAEQQKNTTLNVTATDKAIKLILANTTDTANITTNLLVINASGIVVYNITSYVQPTNGSADYDLSLPETLKAGNYTLRIALKDLAGNTIAEKTIAYTAKAKEALPPPKTTAALSATLTPTMVNGLLVVIMALFIIAGIKTSRISIGGIKDRLNLKQKMLDKAQTAYQQGEYGRAKEYKASAERVSKAELDLMQKIADSEKRILQMYKDGKHLQARKEQDSLARIKKELELLREQHKN